MAVPKTPTHATTTAGPTDRRVPGHSITAWAVAVLIGLGAPVTPDNISALVTWANHESGGYNPSVPGGLNNPLNTTQPGFNSHSQGGSQGNIKDYPTFQDGVNAIVHNLRNPNFGYPAIVAALMRGNDPQGVFAAVDASAFGTHGLAGSSLQTNGIGGGGSPSSGGGGGGGVSATLTGALDSIPFLGGFLNAATAPAKLAQAFIALFQNWRYVVQVGVGVLLIGIAVFLAGKHVFEDRAAQIGQEVGPAAAAAAA